MLIILPNNKMKDQKLAFHKIKVNKKHLTIVSGKSTHIDKKLGNRFLLRLFSHSSGRSSYSFWLLCPMILRITSSKYSHNNSWKMSEMAKLDAYTCMDRKFSTHWMGMLYLTMKADVALR